jgi:cytochrome c biogenesis protein CcdA
MKTKRVASMLPLLVGIGLGIAALASPFLSANHYIFAEGKRYTADHLLFFFWGKYYTVAGANAIQSQMDTYDFGDFPVYAMAVVALGLILGIVSMFGGRGIVLNIKGRILKLKLDINPVWLQMFATIFVILSYIYMNGATSVLIRELQMDNYASEYGPSVDFLLGSAIALCISTIMTATKFLKEGSGNKVESIAKA